MAIDDVVEGDRTQTRVEPKRFPYVPRRAWFGLSLATGLVGTIQAFGAYVAYNPPPYSSVHPNGPGFIALTSAFYALTLVFLIKALAARSN